MNKVVLLGIVATILATSGLGYTFLATESNLFDAEVEAHTFTLRVELDTANSLSHVTLT